MEETGRRRPVHEFPLHGRSGDRGGLPGRHAGSPYYPNDSKVTLIARFNPARLTGGLELPIRNGALLLVTDSRGRFVHGVGAGIEAAQQLQGAAPAGTVRVGDRQYVPVSRSLRSINWRFDLLIPEELLQVEERRALANILINISAVLLSGLAMAIGFSFYNMIPLKRLMGALGFEKEPRARSSGNEFSMLDDRIRNLIANNRDLKEEIDRQTELGVDRFLHQLLTGSYLSLEEINTAARYSGISLDGGSYLVALIELGGYDSGIHEAFLEGMDATAIVVADFLSNKSGGPRSSIRSISTALRSSAASRAILDGIAGNRPGRSPPSYGKRGKP
jgi:hypothetical protein